MSRASYMPTSRRAALCQCIGGRDGDALVAALRRSGDVARAAELLDSLCRDVDAVCGSATLNMQGNGCDVESGSARSCMEADAGWAEAGDAQRHDDALCTQVLRALLDVVAGTAGQQRMWLEVRKLAAHLFQRLETACDDLVTDALLDSPTSTRVGGDTKSYDKAGHVWLRLADAHGGGNYCTPSGQVFRVCARIAPLRQALLLLLLPEGRSRLGCDATNAAEDFDHTTVGRLARLTSSTAAVTCTESWQSLRALLLPDDAEADAQTSEEEGCWPCSLYSNMVLVRYGDAIRAMLLAALDVRDANFVAQGHGLRFLCALLDVSVMPTVVRRHYTDCVTLLVTVLQLCDSPLRSIRALAAAAVACFVVQPHKSAAVRLVLCHNRPALLELFAQEDTTHAVSTAVPKTATRVLQRLRAPTARECAKFSV